MSDDLNRWLLWLYGDKPCICRHERKGLGRLYGVSMGDGWVRVDTVRTCPHHGIEAERARAERNGWVCP